jgi:hypothetical protein
MMQKTRISSKPRVWSRWKRADHAFSVASIALLVVMLGVGFGAWVFSNSGEARVNSPAPYSSVPQSGPNKVKVQ